MRHTHIYNFIDLDIFAGKINKLVNHLIKIHIVTVEYEISHNSLLNRLVVFHLGFKIIYEDFSNNCKSHH